MTDFKDLSWVLCKIDLVDTKTYKISHKWVIGRIVRMTATNTYDVYSMFHMDYDYTNIKIYDEIYIRECYNYRDQMTVLNRPEQSDLIAAYNKIKRNSIIKNLIAVPEDVARRIASFAY